MVDGTTTPPVGMAVASGQSGHTKLGPAFSPDPRT